MPRTPKHPEHPDASGIQEVGELMRLSPRMLRYWEDQGVIAPSRTPGGNRRYTRHDLLIVYLVKQLVESGYNVSDLRVLNELAQLQIKQALTAERPDQIGQPLLLLGLLLLRKHAEPRLHDLIDSVLPLLPPHPPHPPHHPPQAGSEQAAQPRPEPGKHSSKPGRKPRQEVARWPL